MTSPNDAWAAYVRHLRSALGETQGQFALRALGKTGLQGKISRWEDGLQPPNRAADVAAFARALDRNPLEAFVAAGMLEPDEAGRGLGEDERRIVDSAAETPVGEVQPFLLRALEPWAANLSGRDVTMRPAASTETQIEPGDLEDR